MFKGTNIVFRDVIFNLLCGVIAMMLVMLPHLNPPTNEETRQIDSPGNIIVEMFWPADRNEDIDLWVKTPKDPKPIFFIRKSNKVASLLRDDRGKHNDEFERNDEIIFVRGLQAGEYIINAHYYGLGAGGVAADPVPVRIQVTLQKGSKVTVLHRDEFFLRYVKEEYTAYRFTLSALGTVIAEKKAQVPLVKDYMAGSVPLALPRIAPGDAL